jgi:ABC-type lipoprotein export system ATPase subunit/bifunctional DNA-binding transcriptional regulator/antitoxin component of YhaV-PrlF toxin-antitoxin module
MQSDTFILCENLIKIYRLEDPSGKAGETTEVQALQGLDISIQHGEMIGVVGASGSGKSTLLNILGGLDRPTGGRAFVDGRDLGRLTNAELDRYRRETVGFVWQHGSRNLVPYLTAFENVQMPLTLSGRMGAEATKRPAELLELVGLSDRAGHRLEELSGGEQQRVAIAVALVNQPALLLADEPTGELDTVTAKTIYDLLRRLNQELGVTIVIVSHDTGLAHHVSRVVAVRDGKLASETVRKTVRVDGEHVEEKLHLEEVAVLDSAGRLQIPREYLRQFNIHRRVRVEVTADGILIRPTEHDQEVHEGKQPSPSAPGQPEPLPQMESLPGWVQSLQKNARPALDFIRRRFGGKSQEEKE